MLRPGKPLNIESEWKIYWQGQTADSLVGKSVEYRADR
jgi:hypothetical protein